MKREELKELGLTDEQIDKVMSIHGQDVNTLKNDLSTAKATIKTKETEIDGMKAAGDPKDWEKKYNELKTEKEKAESEFSNYKRNSVIKEKLGSKYHNNDLVLEQILKANTELKLNDKNEITAYATVGSFDGGVDCTIPDSVLNDNPLSYKYIDGEFVKNVEYKPPVPPEPPLSEVELEQLALDHEYRLSMLEIGM